MKTIESEAIIMGGEGASIPQSTVFGNSDMVQMGVAEPPTLEIKFTGQPAIGGDGALFRVQGDAKGVSLVNTLLFSVMAERKKVRVKIFIDD